MGEISSTDFEVYQQIGKLGFLEKNGRLVPQEVIPLDQPTSGFIYSPLPSIVVIGESVKPCIATYMWQTHMPLTLHPVEINISMIFGDQQFRIHTRDMTGNTPPVIYIGTPIKAPMRSRLQLSLGANCHVSIGNTQYMILLHIHSGDVAIQNVSSPVMLHTQSMEQMHLTIGAVRKLIIQEGATPPRQYRTIASTDAEPIGQFFYETLADGADQLRKATDTTQSGAYERCIVRLFQELQYITNLSDLELVYYNPHPELIAWLEHITQWPRVSATHIQWRIVYDVAFFRKAKQLMNLDDDISPYDFLRILIPLYKPYNQGLMQKES